MFCDSIFLNDKGVCMSIELIIFLVIVIGFIVYFIAMYNGLVALRNRFKNAYSQIDIQLKRRYDLIPNLVETAKGYLAHERETLEAVIKARHTAVNANQRAGNDPGDAGALQELMGAEAALTGALGKLFALSEAYPDLKASETMMKLMEELVKKHFNDTAANMVESTHFETGPWHEVYEVQNKKFEEIPYDLTLKRRGGNEDMEVLKISKEREEFINSF